MRREILFKAKRKNWRELPKEEWWVEGYVIPDEITGQFFIHARWNSVNESYKIGEEGYLRFVAYEVDSETVCQYTGLTDKNGKKIWENDILRGHGNNTDLSKVVYGEFGMIENETLEVIDIVIGWHYEPIPTDVLSKCEPFCLPMPLTNYYIDRCEFEVIGNIFDNPELLTTNKGA